MRQGSQERERPEGGQHLADALRVAAGLDVQDVAGLEVQVGGAALPFQEVVGVDDQDGGLAVGAAPDDVHVLFVALRRDAADLGQGDGQGQGLAVGDGEDAFRADFAQGQDAGGVGGDQQHVAGGEADPARGGVQVARQQRAQVIDRHLPAVHHLRLGQGRFGRWPAGLRDDGQQRSAARLHVVGAGLADFADHLHLRQSLARGQKQDIAGRERQVLGPVGARKQRGQVDHDVLLAARRHQGRLRHLRAGRRAAAEGEEVQQVHALLVIVLPCRFGPRPQNADPTRPSRAQRHRHLRLVELVAQAPNQGPGQPIHGLARRVDLAQQRVVEGAVRQDRDAGLEVLVAEHGDVDLVVRRQHVIQGRCRGVRRGGDACHEGGGRGAIRPHRQGGREQGGREQGERQQQQRGRSVKGVRHLCSSSSAGAAGSRAGREARPSPSAGLLY